MKPESPPLPKTFKPMLPSPKVRKGSEEINRLLPPLAIFIELSPSNS
jgi:hypothetical protein